ncbi:MAG: hypothetical protein AAF567_18905, partial [Actinomycetota bacterium]
MTLLRRLALFLLTTSLLLAGLALAPTNAEAQAVDGFRLDYSLNLDRSAGAPLDGATVPAGADLAVSLTTPADVTVYHVGFFVDGYFAKVESQPPFDLAGTTASGDAAPSQFAAGARHVVAYAATDAGFVEVSAYFTASEQAPPPPPPAPSILEIATTAGLTNLIDAVIAASGGDINFAAAVADCTSDLTVFA